MADGGNNSSNNKNDKKPDEKSGNDGSENDDNDGSSEDSGSQESNESQQINSNSNVGREGSGNTQSSQSENNKGKKNSKREPAPSNASAKRFSDAKDSISARKKLAKKRKEYKKPNPSYSKNQLNPASLEHARAAKSLGTRLTASKLEPKAKLFDATQKQIKNRLKSRTATARPKPTLDLIDKMENQQRIRANKMKIDLKKIKAQQAIEKAGPYGKLVSIFIGCKSWCLGESAIMLVAFVGGVLGILGLTNII